MNQQWEPYVRVLLYPVQFEQDPVDGVDRVVDGLRRGTLARITVDQAIAAIEQALASGAPLAGVLPQPHGEEAVRRYLAEVLRRLRPPG